MRWCAIAVLVLAACGEDEISPVATQIRRLDNPAERLDALKTLEAICKGIAEDAPLPLEMGGAVPPVLALIGNGETEIRVQAAETLGRIGNALVDALAATIESGEASWRAGDTRHVVSILRALTLILDGGESPPLRGAAANGLGWIVSVVLERREALLATRPAASVATGDLATIEEATRPALAALVRASGEEAPSDVREGAISSLGQIRWKGAVPAITSALRGPWKGVDASSSAAGALMRIGERHAEARVALIDVVADESLPSGRRREAAGALGHLGHYDQLGAEAATAAAALTKCLRERGESSDRWLLEASALALGDIGDTAEPTVLALVDATTDEDDSVRAEALAALGKIGVGSDRVIAAVVACLQDRERGGRQAATAALVALGPKAEPALAALLKTARDPDSSVRKDVAAALGKIGRSDEAVLETLVAATRDEEWTVRVEGVKALGLLALPNPELVSALNEATRDGEDVVRVNAVHALGQCARHGDAALQETIRILGGPDTRLGAIAAAALEELGPRAAGAVPHLIAALGTDDEWLRHRSVAALDAIGPDAAAALPALLKAAGTDPPSRFAVGRAVWHIGGDPSVLLPLEMKQMEAGIEVGVDVLPDLLRELRSEPTAGLDRLVIGDRKAFAVWAVGRLGPDATDAAAVLTAVVRDGPRDLSLTAAAALARIGKPAVPALVELLGSGSAAARSLAATALGEIGRDAVAALPRLRQIAADPDEQVRRAAQAAIDHIGQ